MAEPPTIEAPNPEARWRWVYRRAALALIWERAVPLAWPSIAILALFGVVALTDILSVTPGWVRGLVQLGFAIALGRSLALLARGFHLPDLAAIRRRVEQASGLKHRPLTTLNDLLASTDTASRALWQVHVARAIQATKQLRAGRPNAGLIQRDPRAFRVALGLALVVALIGAEDDGLARLGRALTSPFGSTVRQKVTLDMWITPPAYTGMAPIFANTLPAGQVLEIPTGSKLLAQVSGGDDNPELTVDRERLTFAAIDEHDFRLEAGITEGSHLEVAQDGTVLAEHVIKVLPDNPPTIEIAKPPTASVRKALRLDYATTDDYGVEGVSAEIRRVDGRDADQPIKFTLPPPSNHRAGSSFAFTDLTSHPWAGLPVEVQLTATDAIGQTGQSEWVKTVLPERIFTNKTAIMLVGERRRLIRDPAVAPTVAFELAQIANNVDLFHGDTTVFLGLTTAARRLNSKPVAETVEDSEQLLWDLAVRLEEGDLGARERDLRAAQKAMQDAIQNKAPPAELQKRLDDLKAAMEKYLDALQQKNQTAKNEDRPTDPNAKTIDRSELQKMMEDAQEMMREGRQQEAQALLDKLQQMLENLQGPTTGQEQNGEDGAESEKQQQADQLQDLMNQQKKLLDKSYQQSRPGFRPNPDDQNKQGGQQGQKDGSQGQQGQQSQQGKGQGQQQGQQGGQGGGQGGGGQSGQDSGEAGGEMSPGQMATAQEAIRKGLGDLMRRMGEQGDIPGALGKAERDMHSAAQALKNGSPGQALSPQTDAMQSLREASQALADQIQKEQQQSGGQGGKRGRSQARSPGQDPNRDPLGRSLQGNGGMDNSNTAIPSDNQVQRSRAIYDELRRRASDPNRPQIERDYLQRLMQRF